MRGGHQGGVAGGVALCVVDFLQAVHVHRDQRRDLLRVNLAVVIESLEIQHAGQRIDLAQVMDGENIMDIQGDHDRRAEDPGEIPSEEEGEENAGGEGKGQEDNRDNFRIQLVALFIQNVDQVDAVKPGNDIRKIAQGAALQRSALRQAEHDAGKDGDDVEHRQHQRGDKDEPPRRLLQRVEHHRDNQGRRAVAHRHQDGPLLQVPAGVGYGKFREHDDGEQENRRDQDIHPLDGTLVLKPGGLQGNGKGNPDENQRPVLNDIVKKHRIPS